MKTLFITLFLFVFSVSSIYSQNNDYSKWYVQLNALSVLPDVGDDIKGRDLTMSDEFGFEIGVSYFINKNISTKLTIGDSNHKTMIQYDDFDQHRYSIGDVRIIPFSLDFQYHFYLNKFNPYVGAGANYSFFYVKSEELIGGVYGGEFDSTFGLALQGGVNYNINSKWFVNFDIKKMFISTDMTTYHGWCGTLAKAVPCPDYNVEDIVEKVDINPLSFGLGIGYRFR